MCVDGIGICLSLKMSVGTLRMNVGSLPRSLAEEAESTEDNTLDGVCSTNQLSASIHTAFSSSGATSIPLIFKYQNLR